jgi:hypothetical protein
MAETPQQKPQAPARRRGLSPPVAVVLGLIKGGALGAGAAWVASRALLPLWFLAAVLGVLAGAVAGRAPWHGAAWIATILKALVGFGVGYGAWRAAGWMGVLPRVWIWLPAFGALWSLLVEIDDAVGGDDAAKPKAA